MMTPSERRAALQAWERCRVEVVALLMRRRAREDSCDVREALMQAVEAVAVMPPPEMWGSGEVRAKVERVVKCL